MIKIELELEEGEASEESLVKAFATLLKQPEVMWSLLHGLMVPTSIIEQHYPAIAEETAAALVRFLGSWEKSPLRRRVSNKHFG